MQVQYVRMLEMTTPEIEETVRRALEDNPALEAIDTYENSDRPQRIDSIETTGETDDDSEVYTPESARPSRAWIAGVATDSTDETIVSHLENQLSETEGDAETLKIARYLLGEIDGNGRITRSVTDITNDLAFNAGIEVSAETVSNALDIIKNLDPPGIGAADLRECLLIQLRRSKVKDQATADAIMLLDKHYDLYSRRNIDMLQSASGHSKERLRAADEVIRSLNPKPGAQFAGGDRMERASSVVVPDFNVETDDEGNVTVSLTSNIPDLAIAESFNMQDKADDFIRHHREEAAGTIKLLQMRARTLIRTMQAIAYLQRDFFITEDKDRIRPMVLRDVAKITGDDLSVISRATAGKYVNTPGGVYPLKMFFTEHTQSDPTGEGSLHKILSTLKRIIDNENPQRPYTDEALREKMKEQGFDLARRTVAKYREEKLGIPVARLRRQL